MSQTFTPVWTDNVQVLAPYALIKGSVYEAPTALDLRAKNGAMAFIGIGMSYGANFTTAPKVRIYRALNNDGVSPVFTDFWTGQCDTAMWMCLINNGSNYTVGAQSFVTDGPVGATAKAVTDLSCFWSTITTIPTASGAITPYSAGGVEFLRLAGASSTLTYTDRVSKYPHYDNELVGKANAWQIWLPGGSTYKFVFDYYAEATSTAICCAVSVQTYDSNVGA